MVYGDRKGLVRVHRRVGPHSVPGRAVLIILYIVLPLFNGVLKIVGKWRVEFHFFTGFGMYKSQRLRMERLTWNDLKAVFNELFVFGENRAF